jgi:hypothetical protein
MPPAQPIAHTYEPTDFAMTHCIRCVRGWTRTIDHGTTIIFCRLDREPVLADMISCDRYEPREED